MKKILLSLLAIALLASAVGCGDGGPLAGVGVAQSDKPRESAPDVAASDLDALADGNTAFAFDLYQDPQRR